MTFPFADPSMFDRPTDSEVWREARARAAARETLAPLAGSGLDALGASCEG